MAGKRPTVAEIKAARLRQPKMRQRDLAEMLSISEGEFLSAWCEEHVLRLDLPFNQFFGMLESVGEVMALTRNHSAVHEKVGTYSGFYSGKHASMFLGEKIDLRLFPSHFVHAFEVATQTDRGLRRSIQFFDSHGDAVHKIHATDKTDLHAWINLVRSIQNDDQSPGMDCAPKQLTILKEPASETVEELKESWAAMSDPHQFMPLIRKLDMTRHQAVQLVGHEFAWQIDCSGVDALMRHAANEQIPIMCFVGNPGCIQIHSGPIENIKVIGNWFNIMDEGFNLHLRKDHIVEAWAVRKPCDKGHVTSVEAYDSGGNLILQLFGQRHEGSEERDDWRFIAENLPRVGKAHAA
ncbi:MAG: ChuX/HutX family heme-like substrate-binding protein [Pseudomonadota bacterium]